MKAITQDRYGDLDVLEFGDIDQPVPKDNEVLMRVHAAGLHRGDWHVMTGPPDPVPAPPCPHPEGDAGHCWR
jgi:NADPH:quinone reductase-like Zn-dependent oxidoreductase